MSDQRECVGKPVPGMEPASLRQEPASHRQPRCVTGLGRGGAAPSMAIGWGQPPQMAQKLHSSQGAEPRIPASIFSGENHQSILTLCLSPQSLGLCGRNPEIPHCYFLGLPALQTLLSLWLLLSGLHFTASVTSGNAGTPKHYLQLKCFCFINCPHMNAFFSPFSSPGLLLQEDFPDWTVLLQVASGPIFGLPWP